MHDGMPQWNVDIKSVPYLRNSDTKACINGLNIIMFRGDASC